MEDCHVQIIFLTDVDLRVESLICTISTGLCHSKNKSELGKKEISSTFDIFIVFIHHMLLQMHSKYGPCNILQSALY